MLWIASFLLHLLLNNYYYNYYYHHYNNNNYYHHSFLRNPTRKHSHCLNIELTRRNIYTLTHYDDYDDDD